MSVSECIRDGDLRRVNALREVFPRLDDAVREEVWQRVHGAPRVCDPVLPGDKDYPALEVGTAFDFRTRLWFGCPDRDVRDLLPEAHGAVMQVTARTRARPVAAGRARRSPATGRDPADAFWARFARFVGHGRPFGRLLAPAHERELARYLFALAQVKQAAEARDQQSRPTALARDVRPFALFSAVPVPVMDDLARLSELCQRSLVSALGPTHDAVVQPTFSPPEGKGKKRGDLLVGRCLVEVKASRHRLHAKHLTQVLKYALLDAPDDGRIGEIAVYSARFGSLHRWGLGDLVRNLSGDEALTVAEARRRFQAAVVALAVPPPVAVPARPTRRAPGPGAPRRVAHRLAVAAPVARAHRRWHVAKVVGAVVAVAVGLFAAMAALGPASRAGATGCAAFRSQSEAQAALRAAPADPHRLDGDRDGVACEALAGPFDRSPVTRR